jgi:hypothetical protein
MNGLTAVMQCSQKLKPEEPPGEVNFLRKISGFGPVSSLYIR